MDTKLISIGLGNVANACKIVAIVAPGSAPAKRLVQDAHDNSSAALVDATAGRRCRSVIVMDSCQVVLSSLLPETIARRVNGSIDDFGKEDDDEA